MLDKLKTALPEFWTKHQRAIWITAAVFPFVYVFTPAIYFGKKLRAQVVDSATLLPVSGVEIQTKWYISPFSVVVSFPTQLLHQANAVTDNAGFFEIPAWGPEFWPRWYFLDSKGPKLFLRRTGYEDRSTSWLISFDDPEARVWLWKTIDADWNGKRIGFYPLNSRDDPRLRATGGDPY